jgi:tellurite resistance protein TerC
VTVPIWAWIAFAGFVVTMLAVDLLVLHRRAREVSLKEAAVWSAVWVAIGLGFGGLLWAWRGAGPAQACAVSGSWSGTGAACWPPRCCLLSSSSRPPT